MASTKNFFELLSDDADDPFEQLNNTQPNKPHTHTHTHTLRKAINETSRASHRGRCDKALNRVSSNDVPRRVYGQHHSGTGRGNKFKREGAVARGTKTDGHARATGKVNETAEKWGDKKPSGEKSVVADRDQEPKDKLFPVGWKMTLKEYEKVEEEKRKVLQAPKTEDRNVDARVFESMQQLPNKKDNDGFYIKLGSNKDKRKEKSKRQGWGNGPAP